MPNLPYYRKNDRIKYKRISFTVTEQMILEGKKWEERFCPIWSGLMSTNLFECVRVYHKEVYLIPKYNTPYPTQSIYSKKLLRFAKDFDKGKEVKAGIFHVYLRVFA